MKSIDEHLAHVERGIEVLREIKLLATSTREIAGHEHANGDEILGQGRQARANRVLAVDWAKEP